MIRWMRDQSQRPTRLISSDAVRARATTEFVREGYEVAADCVRFDHRLYEAVPGMLLSVIQELPEECASAGLVGHNPASTDFVNAMVGKPVIDNLPTFGIAILELYRPWRDARFGNAKLVALHSPKSLDGD